jgi:hypothetical protein
MNRHDDLAVKYTIIHDRSYRREKKRNSQREKHYISLIHLYFKATPTEHDEGGLIYKNIICVFLFLHLNPGYYSYHMECITNSLKVSFIYFN